MKIWRIPGWQRRVIIYRILLGGMAIWIPGFVVFGTISSLTHANWAGVLCAVSVVWIFTFWYWEGVRIRYERKGKWNKE